MSRRHHDRRCARCGAPARALGWCGPRCREADRTEAPERFSATVLAAIHHKHERADSLEQEGKPDGAAALRRVADEWQDRYLTTEGN